MDGAHRLGTFAAIITLGACTMIGSSEIADPVAPPAIEPATTGASPPAAGATRSAEPPSRGGNMARYEQSGGTYHVLDTSRGYDERGIASWYGEPFHGRQTSNGETFDMHELSAAHRTLPLPSLVEVTNLANGRKLVLRVNDRGPFHDPGRRIIDVSFAAAVELGINYTGTASVRVRAVEPYQMRTR